MFDSYCPTFIQLTQYSVTVTLKKNICPCFVFQIKRLRRKTIEWKLLHFLVGDTKWVRLSFSVSHNRLRDQVAQGRWWRCQQTCRQWSKDCCPSNGVLQAVSRVALRKRSSPSNLASIYIYENPTTFKNSYLCREIFQYMKYQNATKVKFSSAGKIIHVSALLELYWPTQL